MAPYLRWKVKVVHSLTLTVLLVFATSQARSQSAHTPAVVKKITLSGAPVSFRSMIEHLTKVTGLHFVYSADRINSEKLVTVFAHNKSLDDVLAELGREMNVSFSRQEKYIVIKAKPAVKSVYSPVSKLEIRQWEVHQKIQEPEYTSAFIEPSNDRTEPLLTASVARPAYTTPYFNEYAKQLHVYFDTTLLKNISARDLRALNTRNVHRGWFASGGFMINDYSAGIELQAGFRSLYFVYSPGWFKDGKFRQAYGVGTSFLLSRNFSLNEIYSYSVIKQDRDLILSSPRGRVAEIKNELSARHHQFKVLLQYAATSHISVRFGPSLNYLNTTYSITPPLFTEIKGVGGVVGMVGADGNFATPGTLNHYPQISNQRYRTAAAFQGSLEATRVWIGWEAGVSYRINFFKRR